MPTAGGRRTRVRHFLAIWLFVLSGVAFLDRTNISVAGLQICHEFGLSDQHLGWILSAFLIGYAGFQIPAGFLAARFGPRRVLTIGVMWWAVATALTALLPSGVAGALTMLIVIRCTLGIGESVVYPAANQFVARWIPLQERGFINGLIFAGVGVGSGLTPQLLTWLITTHGWRSAFWFSAIVGLFAGLVWWIFSRDTPEEHPGVSRTESLEIREGMTFYTTSSPEAVQQATGPKISWRAIFTRGDLAALMVGYFAFGYIAWIFFGWFYIYLAKARGLDLKSSAFYDSFPFIFITAFCLFGGWLSDKLVKNYSLRVGRSFLASGSLLLTAVLLVVGSRISNPQVASFILAFAAGALYISQSAFWSVSVDIAGRSSGVFSSIVNMSGQLGGAITVSLTPWLAHNYGWIIPFNVAAVLAVLGGVAWLMVHPERALEA